MSGPPEDRGVNTRALEELFLKSTQRASEWKDVITVSLLEVSGVYNMIYVYVYVCIYTHIRLPLTSAPIPLIPLINPFPFPYAHIHTYIHIYTHARRCTTRKSTTSSPTGGTSSRSSWDPTGTTCPDWYVFIYVHVYYTAPDLCTPSSLSPLSFTLIYPSPLIYTQVSQNVTNIASVLTLITQADRNRSSTATNMNEHSSRSHMILTGKE
jgi:hypothetical protein